VELLLTNFNQPWLSPQNLECYANVILDKGAAITNCFFLAFSIC